MGEISDREEECIAFMDIGMDRIGHATFLPDSVLDRVKILKIPIEICLTSNLLCGTVFEPNEHQFLKFRNEKHPCILCVSLTLNLY